MVHICLLYWELVYHPLCKCYRFYNDVYYCKSLIGINPQKMFGSVRFYPQTYIHVHIINCGRVSVNSTANTDNVLKCLYQVRYHYGIATKCKPCTMCSVRGKRLRASMQEGRVWIMWPNSLLLYLAHNRISLCLQPVSRSTEEPGSSYTGPQMLLVSCRKCIPIYLAATHMAHTQSYAEV